MKNFIDDNTNKAYEFLDSSKMVKGDPYPSMLIIGANIPFSNLLEGAQITEDAANLGYRNIRCSRVKFVIAQKYTKDNIGNPVGNVVTTIETYLESQKGGSYLPIAP